MDEFDNYGPEFNLTYDINGDNFEYAQCVQAHNELFYGMDISEPLFDDSYDIEEMLKDAEADMELA